MAAAEEAVGNKRKKPELLLDDRKRLFYTIDSHYQRGGLPRGIFTDVAGTLPVSATTVSATWKELRAKVDAHVIAHGDQTNLPDSLFATKKSICGQNSRKYHAAHLGDALKEIPLSQRQTTRSTANALGMPYSSFLQYRNNKDAVVKHSSALLPVLNEVNKVARVSYCLDQVDLRQRTITRNSGTVRYKDQYATIHVDEKWFHLTRDGKRYYLAPGEEPPKRRCKHKGYIDKIMFLSAVARPRQINAHDHFDGKIGIWPFGGHQPAQRTSKNRPRGAPVWKNESVTAEVYRRTMINELLPAVATMWPRCEWSNPNFKIYIQQDGAPSHIKPTDEEWVLTLEGLGLQNKIFLFDQPANSPDTNVNDLGVFRALDAAYHRESPRKQEDIVDCVRRTYWGYPHQRINRIWLSHMAIMNKIIECHGDNDFPLPHMNKDRLERLGILPTTLEVTRAAFQDLGITEDDSSSDDSSSDDSVGQVEAV